MTVVNNGKGFFRISKPTERDNAISSYCFRLTRDWKQENLANGKKISAVPLRTEEKSATSEGSVQFSNGFPGKLLWHLTFNQGF